MPKNAVRILRYLTSRSPDSTECQMILSAALGAVNANAENPLDTSGSRARSGVSMLLIGLAGVAGLQPPHGVRARSAL